MLEKNFQGIRAVEKPELSPAYDFVSTIPYIPDDRLALNLSGEKKMNAITIEHFKRLTRKAGLPEYMVIDAVRETIESAFEKWITNKLNYALPGEIVKRIERHLGQLGLWDLWVSEDDKGMRKSLNPLWTDE